MKLDLAGRTSCLSVWLHAKGMRCLPRVLQLAAAVMVLALLGAPPLSSPALAWPGGAPLTDGSNFSDIGLPAGVTVGSVVAGSDGAIWFMAYSSAGTQVGRLDSGGRYTSYPFPATASPWGGLIAGSDGALWIPVTYPGSGDLTTNTNKFGRIATDGSYQEYSLPDGNVALGTVSSGPDGALWFELEYVSYGPYIVLAEMTMGGVYNEYGSAGSVLGKGVVGGDGAFWVQDGAKIGRMTIAGGSITDYALPAGTYDTDLTKGPDGAIWMPVQVNDANGTHYSIGRMGLDGAYHEYPLPVNEITGGSITTGKDGNLWFLLNQSYFAASSRGPSSYGYGVGQMTTTGSYTRHDLPAGYTPGNKMVPAKDGSLRFAVSDSGGAQGIGRFRSCTSANAADLCFRPNPNGYAFENYSGGLPSDLTVADMRKLFGDATVCIFVNGNCNPKKLASADLKDLLKFAANGHCAGLALSSLSFFIGQDDPSNYQPGASSTHDLNLANIRRTIMNSFIRQFYDPARSARNAARHSTPNGTLATLRAGLASNDPDELSIFADSTLMSGHVIVPYAVQDNGNGTYNVYVYDSNAPDDTSRSVIFNANANTWSYQIFASTTWSGNASSGTIGAVPRSVYFQPLVPDFGPSLAAGSTVGAPAGPLAVQPTNTILEGGGHLLITDAQGHRIGFDGGTLVEEIPGGIVDPVVGGLGLRHEPIYTYPPTSTVSILLDGQSVTQTQTTSLTQRGPGYAVVVDGLPLQQSDKHQLSITSDGSGLGLHPTSAAHPDLTLIQEGVNLEYQFQIAGASVGSGQTVSLTVNAGTSRLAFSNALAGGGTFELTVNRLSSSAGAQNFVHSNIAIAATDTEYFDYATWNGNGALTLEIDHGSKGSIDQTIPLDNQIRSLFLPLILRGH